MSSERNKEHRGTSRSNVFLTAQLRHDIGSSLVRIRNISAGGAMLDGPNLPGKGSAVTLHRGSLQAAGTVVWQAGEVRGIRFDTLIDVSGWVTRAGHAGQRKVDQTVQALQTGYPALADRHPPEPAKSDRALGDELQEICERIAVSPNLSTEIAEDLLRIETIALELLRRG